MTDTAGRLQALRDAASSHYRRGDFEAAERAVDEALQIDPLSAELWSNRGTAQAAGKRLDAALLSFERALELKPGHPGLIANRANILLALRHYAEAIPAYEALLHLAPDHPYALGHLIFCKLQCGDWDGLGELRARALAEMHLGKRTITPDLAAAILDSPEDQAQTMRILARDKFPPVPPLWRGERYRNERIRLAYVSADFHAHATATLMAGVFEHHDHRRFETVAISFGPNNRSPMRARLERGFDRFMDVSAQSDTQIAALLRQAEIDIVVDLKGYTSEARPAIFSFRPAPVQINFLGYPGTMGADFLDYLLADRFTVPPAHEVFYSEKIVRLPDGYQPNDRTRVAATEVPTRGQAGLPETGFVFCCFNNSFKIQPFLFDIWMRLLRERNGSVLWLLADNETASVNFKREAAARGVDAARLVFAPRMPQERHLARQRLADIFLDTLPYNAHTTASDALWVGLPVLTCMGGTFAGRAAASVLHAAGLPELVTHSLEEYEATALALARDPQRLSEIRAKLARNRDTHPLFDATRFTRHLEAAFATMWERAQRGEMPASFDVPAK
jgi:protein O-GlcNAc transferase